MVDKRQDADSRRSPGPSEEKAFLDRFKEFRLTSYAVEHKTGALVLLAIITVWGVISYRSVPKESFPEIEIPIVAVNTVYPGVSPADIETLVTRPMEEELNTISDLKELTSTSVEGYSSIVAEFETTVKVEDALAEVREKVDLAKPDLPQDAEEPIIVEFSFDEVPIMQVNLSGEYGLVRLKDIAEDLQDRLEQIPEVLRVDVRGGLEREVKVDVDLAKLQFYGLSFDDVVETIAFENVNIPGGSIDVGSLKYLVRVDGEFEDPSIIADLVIVTEDGRPVYVRDIATVEFGFAERESYARLDGNPVVTLDVIKRSGENIIETATAVRGAIDAMGAEFPPTTVVKITSDQSEDIFMMVSSLENNIISGLLLIISVLFFFLGVRTSVFVGISIPTSMLLSFMILGFLGVTMNMVVLFSLILALGMLVDNAIVVVENIYRYVEQGWNRKLAAKKATGEVAIPVIAATATTLAAFAPLLFWPGISGEFMSYLPLTLIITLSSSLFVALVIVPTLCAMFIRPEGTRGKPLTPWARRTIVGGAVLFFLMILASNWLTALLLVLTAAVVLATHFLVLDRVAHRFQERWLPRILGFYERQLRWALGHRSIILGSAAAALVVTSLVFTRLNAGVEFFPEDIPPRQAWVNIEAPVGTRADFTDRVAFRIEEEVKAVGGMDDAESVVATVGSGNGSGGNPMGGGPSGPEAGQVMISFVDYQDRRQDSWITLANMQERIGKDIAGAEITVDRPQEGPPTGAPVNVELVGEDPDVLKDLSDQLIQVLENAPVARKLVGLESDLDDARPELAVVVDREKAALYGLSTFDVGNAIRGAIQGIEAAKYRTGNDEYDIVVRLAEGWRDELSALQNLTVMSEGDQIPLLSVADWKVGEGYGSIRRKDMDRMATISSEVAAGQNSNAVLAEVRATLASFEAQLPPGYTIRYTGQNEEQAEAQEFLSRAFLAALALIAFILISQFNSVVKPVIILTSVIMSTVGVLLGLMLFRMPFGIIMTGVGIISLAGIVVNNAIVLMDYIDILRDRDGMDRREALILGGRTRFRPVVLTAVTTALGLVPLAIGLNFDFFGLYGSLDPELYWGGDQAAWWGPMAVAVIAGIIFATFLTLILVPVMYSLVDDFSSFFRRHYVQVEEGATGPGVDQTEDESEDLEPAGRPGPGRSGTREPAAVYSGRSPGTLPGPALRPQE
jgi:multidrug efflux pump subunit AcrB